VDKYYKNFVSVVQLFSYLYTFWTWVWDFVQSPETAMLLGFVATLETILTVVTQYLVHSLLDLKDQIFAFGYTYFEQLQPIKCVFAFVIGFVLVLVLFSVIFSFASMWPCEASGCAVRRLYKVLEAMHTIALCGLLVLQLNIQQQDISAQIISRMQHFPAEVHVLMELPDKRLCIFLSVLSFFVQFFSVFEEIVLVRQLLRSLLCDILVVNAVRYMNNQENVLFWYCVLMLFITVPTQYLVPRSVLWTLDEKQMGWNFWWLWLKAIVIQDHAVALPINNVSGSLKLAAPFKRFLHLFSIVNCLWTICALCKDLLSKTQKKQEEQKHAAKKTKKETNWLQDLLLKMHTIIFLLHACIVLCVHTLSLLV